MSASDEIINRLVAVTLATGPFAQAWERLGPDTFRMRESGETVSHVWANMVLQQIHVGADLQEVLQ